MKRIVESKKAEIEVVKTLIHISATGARGEEITSLQIDWPLVFQFAVEQGVVSLVALTVLHSPGLQCPEELRESILNILRVECSTNLVRKQQVLHLVDRLIDAGIKAKILKGYAVAENYACPESRSSVDTDLLIDAKQEKKALRFFAADGFRITPRVATSHHSICYHKKYGKIELHVSLYNELVESVWFQEVDETDLIQEEPITIQTMEGKFATLGYTDHLIFIILHMVKHFIIGGLTLRMMLDVTLYFSKNKEKIDAIRLWSILDRLHYSQLVNCVLWLMILYGGFQKMDFPGCATYAPEQIPLLLNDLIQGGYMGVKEMEIRYASSMEYSRQLMLKSRSSLEYQLFMLRYKARSARKHMFLSPNEIREIYPKASQYVGLMPILFVYHAFAYPITKMRAGVLKRDIRLQFDEISQESQMRLDVFRKLGML